MPTGEWTHLVQRVEQLITQLRTTRAELNHWRSRATELERLHLKDEHSIRRDEQAKDRELERLRREHKKVATTIVKIIAEINQAQREITEQTKDE